MGAVERIIEQGVFLDVFAPTASPPPLSYWQFLPALTQLGRDSRHHIGEVASEVVVPARVHTVLLQ